MLHDKRDSMKEDSALPSRKDTMVKNNSGTSVHMVGSSRVAIFVEIDDIATAIL